MCTYCGTKNYYKIYEKHHGSIGTDSSGRTLEIHHIDGDHNNNDPLNLTIVTIQEHYDIHFSQKDHGACQAMAIRMNIAPETLSELARKHAQERVSNGTHHFLGSSNNNNRVANGTHPFLNGSMSRKVQEKRVKDGTHHLLGPKHNKNRIAKGKHNLVGPKHNKNRIANGTHPSQRKVTCLSCMKMTDISHYNKYHKDNCKQTPQSNT